LAQGKKRAKITATRTKKRVRYVWSKAYFVKKGTAVGVSNLTVPPGVKLVIEANSATVSDFRKMTSMSGSGGYKPLDH